MTVEQLAKRMKSYRARKILLPYYIDDIELEDDKQLNIKKIPGTWEDYYWKLAYTPGLDLNESMGIAVYNLIEETGKEELTVEVLAEDLVLAIGNLKIVEKKLIFKPYASEEEIEAIERSPLFGSLAGRLERLLAVSLDDEPIYEITDKFSHIIIEPKQELLGIVNSLDVLLAYQQNLSKMYKK